MEMSIYQSYNVLLVIIKNFTVFCTLLLLFRSAGNSLSRIINGQDSSIADHPHQISLQKLSGTQWYHICGGSILAETWIITAAHCVETSTWALPLYLFCNVYIETLTDEGLRWQNSRGSCMFMPCIICDNGQFHNCQSWSFISVHGQF